MRYINHLSDFQVIINITDKDGNIISPPSVPWEAVFSDENCVEFKCYYDGNNYTHCIVDGNDIVCFVDNPGFSCGKLRCTFSQHVPSVDYCDGVMDLSQPLQCDIMLSKRESDDATPITIEASPNWAKGEQGIQGIQGEKGADGFSPIVSLTKDGSISTLSITDAQGEHTTEIADGAKGDDGFSPIVSLNKVDKVTTLTITDAQGTHTATVNDGDSVEVVQSTGTSTTAVMSQKAVTHKFDTLDLNISNIKGELHGTTPYNITVTFNSIYEYQTIDKITAGTKIKNNTNNGYLLYDKTGGTQVGSLIANSSVVLEADITSIRIMGDLEVTPFNAEFTIGETKEGFIEKTNKNDTKQNAELEALNKNIYEVIYNKYLWYYEFYGSETEPLSHIIRKGSVVKNNSVNSIAIYNSDKSIEIILKPQEIITTDFDIYFLRNWETSQTINVSVASALDSSLFRENAIKKLVLGYRINLNNLTEFQYYPKPGKASNILVNKDVNVKNNGTYAVTLHDRKDSQNVKIESGKRVRVPFDVYYIRNYAGITANVSLEIEGLPSVEERVKVLEEKPSSSFDSVIVNVSDSTGIPSGSASLDNGVLTLQLNNIKGERGNDGAQGVQGNSGVASSDGIESIQDLSQDIPNDTIERVYVAGAKVVKDKIEHLYRDKAPYSQFYGNGNTAKNINGGSGKNVIIGDDNAMYANNESSTNTLIGYHADYGLTTGYSNTAIGCEALDRNRSGHDNVAVGMFAVGCNSLNGEDPTTYKSCNYNVGVGAYALHHNGGIGNTAIGNFSSQSLDDDDTDNSNGNTAVGNYSLAYNKQGSYNVCIGNAAGKYSQGSLELYIDAIDRGDDSRNNPENITKGRTKSLVYGKFNGSPSSQEFHINAGLIVMPYLPSSDPHVSGALWNDGGTLKISNG